VDEVLLLALMPQAESKSRGDRKAARRAPAPLQ
jgi:hypothetical protein